MLFDGGSARERFHIPPETQRARGLTEKHNSASKRLHNLPAIAPRFGIVLAVFSDASHMYTLLGDHSKAAIEERPKDISSDEGN